MINVIFKTKASFGTGPNELIPISKDYSLTGNECAFGDLSKTNIFIGENNSGKSRFLRCLFKEHFFSLNSEGIEKLLTDYRSYLRTSKTFNKKECISNFNFIYNEAKNKKLKYSIDTTEFVGKLRQYISNTDSQKKYYFPAIRGVKDYKTILDTKLKTFLKSATSIQNKDSINHYISLLNLEKDGLESFDIYREITLHEYFPKSNLNIITGGDLYGKIKSMLLGNEKQRKTISEFQSFLRKHFFSEYETVQLIPYESEKVLYVKIGNDERPIYNWGDGTQQLIIILFSLFIYKDELNNLFFIEEPEIYLHPGILRKFIEVINSDIFPNHQYFITTHSNTILDVSADTNINMSIFKFTKNKNCGENDSKFLIEQCNSGDVSLLNALGIRNSSVFLSNCSIWIEGITDRLYLKHFLSLYFKKYENISLFRENIDYTFIEYGGGNIVHFNFENENSEDKINAKYINNRIFLIADNDNTKPGSKKAQRKENLKQTLGDNFYELSVTEIENLLSQETIKQILIEQNPKHVQIIEEKFLREKMYKNRKLGRYLDDLFKDSGVKKYSAESGTIKNKLEFCQTAIELITDYDMLTDEAKDLVEKVVDFMKANN